MIDIQLNDNCSEYILRYQLTKAAKSFNSILRKHSSSYKGRTVYSYDNYGCTAKFPLVLDNLVVEIRKVSYKVFRSDNMFTVSFKKFMDYVSKCVEKSALQAFGGIAEYYLLFNIDLSLVKLKGKEKFSIASITFYSDVLNEYRINKKYVDVIPSLAEKLFLAAEECLNNNTKLVYLDISTDGTSYIGPNNSCNRYRVSMFTPGTDRKFNLTIDAEGLKFAFFDKVKDSFSKRASAKHYEDVIQFDFLKLYKYLEESNFESIRYKRGRDIKLSKYALNEENLKFTVKCV